MSFLQCPECRLTVSAAAYYLRGDQCPRCMTTMDKRPTFRSAGAPVTQTIAGKVAPASAKPTAA